LCVKLSSIVEGKLFATGTIVIKEQVEKKICDQSISQTVQENFGSLFLS
jgi:hypothetical protein